MSTRTVAAVDAQTLLSTIVAGDFSSCWVQVDRADVSLQRALLEWVKTSQLVATDFPELTNPVALAKAAQYLEQTNNPKLAVQAAVVILHVLRN